MRSPILRNECEAFDTVRSKRNQLHLRRQLATRELLLRPPLLFIDLLDVLGHEHID